MRAYLCLLSLLGSCLSQATARAEDSALPTIAKRLSSHVVTVRVTHKKLLKNKVTVCTGVAVAPNLVVTSCFAGENDQIRLTIPGGTQAQAKLRVIDDYSGLALLSTASTLAPVKLAKKAPTIGSKVLSAAAWGPESPVVTFGMVSGTERRLQDVSYPPLLQCDVRTTKTSAGAIIANYQGDLVGIVTLIERERDRNGFTYAIPVSHIRRILNIKRDPNKLVVVQRRRPVVGMALSGARDQIKVARLEKDGPAAQAGLKVGDRVLAVEGIRIRSVYQALQPVIYKQPGDKVRYLLMRDSEEVEAQVVLGGGAVLPNATYEQVSKYVSPKLLITKPGLPPREPVSRVGNVGTDGTDFGPGTVTAEQKIELLEKALTRYRKVIELQQGQLAKERRDRDLLEQRLESVERMLMKALKK